MCLFKHLLIVERNLQMFKRVQAPIAAILGTFQRILWNKSTVRGAAGGTMRSWRYSRSKVTKLSHHFVACKRALLYQRCQITVRLLNSNDTLPLCWFWLFGRDSFSICGWTTHFHHFRNKMLVSALFLLLFHICCSQEVSSLDPSHHAVIRSCSAARRCSEIFCSIPFAEVGCQNVQFFPWFAVFVVIGHPNVRFLDPDHFSSRLFSSSLLIWWFYLLWWVNMVWSGFCCAWSNAWMPIFHHHSVRFCQIACLLVRTVFWSIVFLLISLNTSFDYVWMWRHCFNSSQWLICLISRCLCMHKKWCLSPACNWTRSERKIESTFNMFHFIPLFMKLMFGWV